MNNNFLRQVDSKTDGILWLTEGDLSKETPFFKEINYLLDGLLTQQLNDEKSLRADHKLFLGKSFSKPFFIVQQSNNSSLNKINQALKTVKANAETNILVLNESALNPSDISSLLKDLTVSFFKE